MKFLPLIACMAMTSLAPIVQAASPAPPPSESDWRTPDPENVLVIDTNKGRIFFELAPKVAPLSAARVRELAKAHFYDGQTFFRVIEGFMDQTGDPTNTGTGGSKDPNLPAEFSFRRGSDLPMAVISKEGGVESGFIGVVPVFSQTLDLALLTADNRVKAWGTFCPGVGGMARAEAPDSANSQFFLMRGFQGALDEKYAVFGRVIAGQDVVNAIKTGEPVTAPQDKMISVRVLSDLPAAGRPTVRVVDTQGPWFKAEVDRVRADKVVGMTPCDLDIPSQVK